MRLYGLVAGADLNRAGGLALRNPDPGTLPARNPFPYWVPHAVIV